MTENAESNLEWYVMRDLKRANAKLPAYKLLEETGFEVFTPMKWRLATRRGTRIREIVPVIPDLLFVKSTRDKLNPMVEKVATLQYRYGRGNSFKSPMTVPFKEMENFMKIANSSLSATYILPEEITPSMYGKRISIVGGPLDACEGYLVTLRGSKRKRILVELTGLLAVRVEVDPEFIRFC